MCADYSTIMIIGDDIPEMKELYNHVIHRYAAQWQELGVLLGLEDYNIVNISKSKANEVVDCCRDMLRMWLQSICSPTWGKLEDAIRQLPNQSKQSHIIDTTTITNTLQVITISPSHYNEW